MSKRSIVFPGVRGEPIKPKIGIWPDVPFDQYLAWNAISNSSMSAAVRDLNPLVISMAHYRDQQPLDESPSLRFGKYCHAGRFEFLTALKDFVVLPDLIKFDLDSDGNLFESQCKTADNKPTDSKNSAQYKDRLKRFSLRHIGKEFVTEDEKVRKEGFLHALDADAAACEYFKNHGPATQYEVAVCWKDPLTGLLCKGRMDCVQHGTRQVIDLKTTPDICSFGDSIARFGYHRQGAFYAEGLQILTGHLYESVNVAGETKAPFTIGARPLDYTAMITGHMQYRAILNAIAAAVESDTWPGPQFIDKGKAKSAIPDKWQIPPWAMPDKLVV